MDHSQILLEMLDRIKTLEKKVEILENQLALTNASEPQSMERLNSISPKYRKLAEYLLSSNEVRVTLSYSQIEEILGFPLPNTARKTKPSFWANTKSHSYASSWLAVGYKTKINAHDDNVTFVKNLE